MFEETEPEHEGTDVPNSDPSDGWPRLSDVDLEICLLATEPRRARSSARPPRTVDPPMTDRHVERR